MRVVASMVLCAALLAAQLVFPLPAAAGEPRPPLQTAAASKAGKACRLSHTAITMYAGEDGGVALTALSGQPVSGKCTWKVSDPKVLQLEKGRTARLFFKALKKGSVTITCTKDGRKYKCKVKVKSMLKKSDMKVLASYVDENGDTIQLLRVKNGTKAARNISLYQLQGDVMHTWHAVRSGKHAYLIRNKSQKTIVSVYRQNARNGLLLDTNPGKNLTSKVKAKVKVGEGNHFKITYKNSYKYPVHITAVYVLYDAAGNAIHMNYDSADVHAKRSVKLPEGRDSYFICPSEQEAVSAKIYVNAVGYY